jgi:hypothetical protein
MTRAIELARTMKLPFERLYQLAAAKSDME